MSPSQNPSPEAEMTFWDHLDALRGNIIRSIAAILGFAVLAFCFKKILFDGIILYPLDPSFPTYRIMGIDFEMKLINIELSTQFFVHMRMAASAGLVLAFPYVVYELWEFIAPALYKNEKVTVRKAFALSTVLFYLGVLVGYYLVLPLCLNFFAGYSVSSTVENSIALGSYISIFTSLVIMIGIVFEFPMLVMALSGMGLITRSTLRKYRRHAIVAVLCVSAIITPADPLSMIVLAIPLYGLFEFSIFCARKDEKSDDEEEEEGEEE